MQIQLPAKEVKRLAADAHKACWEANGRVAQTSRLKNMIDALALIDQPNTKVTLDLDDVLCLVRLPGDGE
jgi:hypothetical protein